MHTFDDEVLLRRRSGLVLAGAAAPALFGAALAAGGQPSALGVGLALGWVGIACFLYAWAYSPLATSRLAHVHVDARGLFVDGRIAVPADRLAGGSLTPRPGASPLVRIARRWQSNVELVPRSLESGRALLSALDLDPTHGAARYWAMARPLGEPRGFVRPALVLLLILVFGVLAGQFSPAALAFSVVALVVGFAAAAVPSSVTVGGDGLLLRWLGTSRFVAWHSVSSIEPFDGGVVVTLVSGRTVTLRLPGEHERYQPERDEMLERMRAALRTNARPSTDEATATLVRRAGSRTREWVRAVRSFARAGHGYRASQVPVETLWRVIEDPSAHRHARTGAAIALAPALDEEGRRRMRAVAGACAEPRLRASLTMAATTAAATADEIDVAALVDEAEQADPSEEEA